MSLGGVGFEAHFDDVLATGGNVGALLADHLSATTRYEPPTTEPSHAA